ncbi:alpha/beta fold hydrolase [Pontibacter cellulosilyticus]|uniref:Alpha/beta hydrolase n=1 Tax=Pontibacter cellulosilyticus TaxID=1720253 RepID=A0A923N4I1_9BACT|nr:alpha/beta hydrolase [Pontibacter cellulosilyticus]MBC5992383.1 alpha/beta hydrolase [Pontibacter cellulosilyticus]
MKLKHLFLAFFALLLITLVALPYVRSAEKFELNDETRKSIKGSFVRLPSGVTHYELAGPEGAPVVVLVHGFSVPAYIWDSNFNELAKAGFRVLRYDQFGRGFSDRPAVDYNAAFYHNQLNELLAALKVEEPVNLVGVSMGGAIVAGYTAAFPDRVNKVALLAPYNQATDISILKTPYVGDYLNQVYLVPTLLEGQASDFFNASVLPANYKSNFAAQMEYKGFDKAILSTLRNFISKDPQPYFKGLAETQKPILLIWGKNDPTVPYNKELTQMLNPKLILLDSCGHIPQIEYPEEVNRELVSFLGSR